MRKSTSACGRLVVFGAAALLAFSGSAGAWAEEGENDEEGGGTKVPVSTCVSGMKWTAGDEGSPEMHPGRSCIDCHATGEGPRFIAAGTVFRRINEPDDCYGVGDVAVLLTDVKGKVFRTTTNRAGNFVLRAGGSAISFPIRAKLRFEGKERQMATPQRTGNCAACHTAAGENGAPGRIIAP